MNKEQIYIILVFLWASRFLQKNDEELKEYGYGFEIGIRLAAKILGIDPIILTNTVEIPEAKQKAAFEEMLQNKAALENYDFEEPKTIKIEEERTADILHQIKILVKGRKQNKDPLPVIYKKNPSSRTH